MVSMWHSHLKSRSLACAPSCAGASTARGQPLPGGRRCAPPFWRASGSGKQARAAFTMPSSMSGALCTATTSPSP
eukprot:11171068-Alexandrium_andersonii.AAC.1